MVHEEFDNGGDGIIDSVTEYTHDEDGNTLTTSVDSDNNGTPDTRYGYQYSDDPSAGWSFMLNSDQAGRF